MAPEFDTAQRRTFDQLAGLERRAAVRAAKRAAQVGGPDPLVKRGDYALGMARRLGFFACIGRSPIAMAFVGRKIRESYARRDVAPLPADLETL